MIQNVFSTLFQVLVPLALPVIAGALLSKYKQLDIKPLLVLVLYYFTPVVIFDTLINAEVSHQDVYQTFAFSLLNLLLLWGAANGLGKLLRLSQNDIAGLTLISAFTNCVNYGIPLILLAFGQLGLDKASVFIVLQMIIVNTVGIYFAARSHFTIKNAIKSVFSLPAIYAAVLAFLLRIFDIPIPSGIASGFSMIADAYSPIVLAILGAQMMNVKTEKLDRKTHTAYWTGMGMRMLIAPIIALICLYILKIDGLLFSVLLILACMPVAVNAGILASKFDASPKIVTKSILWTTLLSFIVLPFLIVLVK
ncbi:AEC family transporter [Niallia endozanthoxylica]|uniref:AEC family transporter n=1 Tax=Niallia endozanthoxylica TaxID=2036016 RepID=A0A5J5HVR2_9BACI|nr:AEC family transporter [Niallia endozanthoxylica]KAA9026946.1 AEC family transporter [Niallia endozanthoxylica]